MIILSGIEILRWPMALLQQQHSAREFPVRHPETIGILAAEISAACDTPREMPMRIRAALEAAVRDPGLLGAAQCEPISQCYARHVIYADPLGRFTVLAIVWDAGQFSSPHAHDTWCAYAVYDGSLCETLYTACS